MKKHSSDLQCIHCVIHSSLEQLNLLSNAITKICDLFLVFIVTILEINAHSLTVNVSSLHFVSKLSEYTFAFSLFLDLRPPNASIVSLHKRVTDQSF